MGSDLPLMNWVTSVISCKTLQQINIPIFILKNKPQIEIGNIQRGNSR